MSVQLNVPAKVEFTYKTSCPKCGGMLTISNSYRINSAAAWMNCGSCGLFQRLKGSISVVQDPKP